MGDPTVHIFSGTGLNADRGVFHFALEFSNNSRVLDELTARISRYVPIACPVSSASSARAQQNNQSRGSASPADSGQTIPERQWIQSSQCMLSVDQSVLSSELLLNTVMALRNGTGLGFIVFIRGKKALQTVIDLAC